VHQITDAEMQAEMKRLLTGIQVKWAAPEATPQRKAAESHHDL